jgi:4-amino-4-deoxy-L-arabinose transferase-like glycosyltransferase
LLAVFAFDLAMPGRIRPRALQWQGLLAFVVVALPWYALVTGRNPGLLGYFLGNEVVGRVASDEFARHGNARSANKFPMETAALFRIRTPLP